MPTTFGNLLLAPEAMSTTTAYLQRQKFLPVPLHTLCVTGELPVDIYLCQGRDDAPVLFRRRNIEIPPDEFPKLLESGIETVFISRDHVEVYQQHLEDNVAVIIANESLPLERRLQFLGDTGRSILHEVFQADQLDQTLEAVDDLSNHMVELFAGNEVAVSDLFSVLRHDYHTYTHSYNVASYAMLLGKELGFSSDEKLRSLSVGGLLHDLGKLKIPRTILNNKGRLDNQDWDIIRRHPFDGFVALVNRPEVSRDQLMMVYQHHERIDGSGYPVGLIGDEIHPFARICSVVDVFDALTSSRPYRIANTTNEALETLDRLANDKLDAEMVQCWKALMKKRS